MKGEGESEERLRRDRVRDYYHDNPLMVSSPFGGVDGVNRELLLEVFDRLDIGLDGKRILDVGCGRGYVGEVVRDQGGDYTGIDIVMTPSPVSLPRAISVAAQLPFPDAYFDGLLCIDAFEHFPDALSVAREFRRVLKPGGFVFLSVPNYANVAGLVKWYCEHFGRYAKDTWAPFRNWQPQELERPLTGAKVRHVFQDAGFTRMRRIGHGPEAGLGLFPWMQHPRMPERITYRLQRLFHTVGPAVTAVLPGSSLHGFWRIEEGVVIRRREENGRDC